MTTLSDFPGHPAPLVVARTATPDEIPKSAKLLADRARAAGWVVWVAYARGTRLRSDKVTDSITVRCHRGTQRLVGLWVEGAFSTGLSSSPFKVLNSRELTAAVTA